eukprot:2464318-Prymnesium_polylepis.4
MPTRKHKAQMLPEHETHTTRTSSAWPLGAASVFVLAVVVGSLHGQLSTDGPGHGVHGELDSLTGKVYRAEGKQQQTQNTRQQQRVPRQQRAPRQQTPPTAAAADPPAAGPQHQHALQKRLMTPRDYTEIQSSPYPALVKLDPPDCENCPLLADYWAKATGRYSNTWHVECNTQPAICVDRRVGMEKRGPRAVFGVPDAQPSFHVWTGGAWLRYMGPPDMHKVTNFLVSAINRLPAEKLVLAARGATPTSELPPELQDSTPPSAVGAEQPFDPLEAGGGAAGPVVVSTARRWGDSDVHEVDELRAVMAADLALLRIDPPRCKAVGVCCCAAGSRETARPARRA